MLTDVIASLATPPGRSAVALIRVSGRGAFDVAASVLRPFVVDPARVARRARAIHPITGDVLDDVLYTAFAEPASYSGEDLVEIGAHGGLLVPAEVLGALLAAGARQAVAGEFTRRAVANGKLDLLQAEAIADLIDATAPAQRRHAINQLDRGLSARIAALRDDVLELEALVSYDIDFPEEDEGPIPASRIDQAIDRVKSAIQALLGTAVEGERLREGALCVIAGVPNVGKSSLFNALLGRERAIVTEIAGTTRDAIEAPAICGGFPFRLVDTAGLREGGDRVERLGIEVSRRYLEAADVVLFCIEAGREMSEEERRFVEGAKAPVVVVRTKGDLVKGAAKAGSEGVTVSATGGQGLAALREALARMAFSTLSATGDLAPVLTRERHRRALTRALKEVEGFRGARRERVEGAVAATYLRAAVTELEDVIGLVTPEEVLDRVFGRFCVGK